MPEYFGTLIKTRGTPKIGDIFMRGRSLKFLGGGKKYSPFLGRYYIFVGRYLGVFFKEGTYSRGHPQEYIYRAIVAL